MKIKNPKPIYSTLAEWNSRARLGRVVRVEFTNTFRGICRSRFGREHQRCVVGDDRTAFQVPFVRVYVIGAPLEPAAGESAQISGQTPFSRHEVQPHFEFLLEFFLQINRRAGGGQEALRTEHLMTSAQTYPTPESKATGFGLCSWKGRNARVHA